MSLFSDISQFNMKTITEASKKSDNFDYSEVDYTIGDDKALFDTDEIKDNHHSEYLFDDFEEDDNNYA